jgi:penicillin-binding protein 1A
VIARYGEATVYGGGLKIRTTLDIEDQQAAEASIAKVLNQPNDPQAALVALDQTGGVKAYVGGRDFKSLQVDLARGKAGGGTGRQPGSTFKPFVLADALEQGATLGETFAGPKQITLNTAAGPWTVDNYGGESFGSLSLLDATAHSVNTVYAQLMLGVGPPTVPPLAARMGITSPLKPDPSLVLGSGEVSPLDMADSYLTFARDGSHVAPHAIAEIKNAAGKVLFKAPDDKGDQAMKPETSRGVTYALRQVIAKGTGTAARLDRPVAGKTGTTTDFGDAWFAGYTPNYAAVVWMGYPEGPTHQMTDVHGRSVTGGSFPAQIWQSFMKAALADVPVADFPAPPPDMLKPAPPAQLAVNPSSGDPGVQLTVQGTGFRPCFAGWFVSFEPQTVQLLPGSSPPGPVETAPQTSSNEDQRTVQFPVPSGSPPGQYLIRAWCDAGAGPQPMGEVQFTVTGALPTTLPPPPTAPQPTPPPKRTTTTTAPTTTTPTTAKH